MFDIRDMPGNRKRRKGRRIRCAKCGKLVTDYRGRICGKCAFPNGVKTSMKKSKRAKRVRRCPKTGRFVK